MISTRALLVSLLLLQFPHAHAAIVDVEYSLRGGAAFLTASGTVSANIRGSILGIPYNFTRTGAVSGATSWNIDGDLELSIDEGETSPSIDSVGKELRLTRRAGTIFVDFPLIQIGSLNPISIDLSVASNGSSARITSTANLFVSADGAGGMLRYEAPTGFRIDGPLFGPIPVPVIYGAFFAATNELEGSNAVVVPIESSFNEPHIMATEHCLDGIIGTCVATVAVTYDFSGMVFTLTAEAASGTSATLLPLPQPIPLPATVWLLGPAIGGVGMMRKKAA